MPYDGESDDETKGESKLAIMQIRMRPRTNLPQSAQVGTWKTVHHEISLQWSLGLRMGLTIQQIAYNYSGQGDTQPDIGAIMGSTNDLKSA